MAIYGPLKFSTIRCSLVTILSGLLSNTLINVPIVFFDQIDQHIIRGTKRLASYDNWV